LAGERRSCRVLRLWRLYSICHFVREVNRNV